MSILETQPQTLNFLSPLNYSFLVKKCPAVNFFAQKVIVPGISNQSPITKNPFTDIPYGGDHFVWEPFVVDFKIDEKLQNYLEIFNWMLAIGFPEKWDQYKALEQQPKYTGTGLKSDISVIVLDAHKLPLFECSIIDAYPVALSSMPLNSVDTDVKFVTCQATFAYTNFIMNSLLIS